MRNDSIRKLPAPKLNGRRGQLSMIPLTPRENKLARAQARGWNDVRRGRGFRETYDGWPRKRQWAYERGRLQATLAKAAGGRLTRWKWDEVLSSPLHRAVGQEQSFGIIAEAAQLTRRIKRKKRKECDMSLVIDDPNDIDLVRRALQRYRKEQITKKIKFQSGEWKGDYGHVEEHIAQTDKMIERCAHASNGMPQGEATVTPRPRFA